MSASFDPYHVWLGIPPKDQPPHHYRLLGLEPLEADAGVIENAADRQMAHVRRLQTGKHAADAQKILNQISAARGTLLDASRKAAYDEQLGRQFAAKAHPAPPRPPVLPPGVAAVPSAPPKASEQIPAPPAEETADIPTPPRPVSWKLVAGIAGIAAGGAVLAIALLVAVILSFTASKPGDPITAPVRAASIDGADEVDIEDQIESHLREVAPPVEPQPALPKADEPKLPAPQFTLAALEGNQADLLAAADPGTDTMQGEWLKADDRLTAVPATATDIDRLASILAASVAPPQHYEIQLSVTRKSGNGAFGLGLPLGDDRQAIVLIDDKDGNRVVEQAAAELPVEPPPGSVEQVLTVGSERQVVCRVVEGRITAAVDGATIVDWSGDAAQLDVPRKLVIAHKSAFYMIADNAAFDVTRLQLVRVQPPPMPMPPPTVSPPNVELPPAIARWTFNEDFRDEIGVLDASPQGAAHVRDGRLHLDGTSYVVTTMLTRELAEKTLSAWVALATLDQRGAGVITVSQGRGLAQIYDGIAYAEQEEKMWAVGSNRRRRTQRLAGPAETAAAGELIHVAAVFQADGTIVFYRNGKPYGSSYQAREVVTFPAEGTQISLGRLAPPAEGLLVGSIDEAQLFDRALSPAEVASLAAEPPSSETEKPRELAARPSDEELEAARERVRTGYKDSFDAAVTPLQKKMLGDLLLDGATATSEPSAGRYALFEAARDAFAQAGDVDGVFKTADRFARDFEVDSFQLKHEAIPVAARNVSGPQEVVLARGASDLVDEAVARDDFATARQLAQIASSAARQAKALSLVREISDQTKEVAELARKFSDVKTALETLETAPDDPAANLVVGKYRCFVNQDWPAGLPHLAASSDAALKSLAERELADPTEAAEQGKLGDDWWNAAENAEPVYRMAHKRRAGHWYEKAAPLLTGLEQLVAKRHLLELETAANDGWRVIFRSNNPAYWNTPIDQPEAYAISLEEVAETIKFLRLRRTDTGQFVIIPMTKDLLEPGGAISQRLLWRTEVDRRSTVPFLGVANNMIKVADNQPYIYYESRTAYGGWGFGSVWQQPGTRSTSWAGQPLVDVEIEISVKSESLSPDETRALLR